MEAETDVANEPPELANRVFHPRHFRCRCPAACEMFMPDKSGQHGMNAFDNRTPSVPKKIPEHPPVFVPGYAPQRRAHLTGRVELLPRAIVRVLPFTSRHERMVDHRLKRIVVVQVFVHWNSGDVLPDMIFGTR